MTSSATNEAVAVLAVRNRQSGGLEVLVFRDRETNCWVASGRVQDADTSSAVLARCRGVTGAPAHRRFGPRMPTRQCLGHWVAANRELFVRTGELFCTRGDSDTQIAAATRARLMLQRSRVETLASDFARVLESEDLFCDLSALLPFTTWCASKSASDRTHTQIFLAGVAAPLRHERHPAHPGGDWLAPEMLLMEWQRGQTTLDFMTYGCLRVLSDFQSVEALLAEYGRQP